MTRRSGVAGRGAPRSRAIGQATFVIVLANVLVFWALHRQIGSAPDKTSQALALGGFSYAHEPTLLFASLPLLLGALGGLVAGQSSGEKEMRFPALNAAAFWLFLLGSLAMIACLGPISLGGLTGLTDGAAFWTDIGVDGAVLDLVILSCWAVALSLALWAVVVIATFWREAQDPAAARRRDGVAWALFALAWGALPAAPGLAGAATLLLMNRHVGTEFFDPLSGGPSALQLWLLGQPGPSLSLVVLLYALVLTGWLLFRPGRPLGERGLIAMAAAAGAIGLFALFDAAWRDMARRDMALPGDFGDFGDGAAVLPPWLWIGGLLAMTIHGAVLIGRRSRGTPQLYYGGAVVSLVLGLALSVLTRRTEVADPLLFAPNVDFWGLDRVAMGFALFGLLHEGVAWWSGRTPPRRLGAASFCLLAGGAAAHALFYAVLIGSGALRQFEEPPWITALWDGISLFAVPAVWLGLLLYFATLIYGAFWGPRPPDPLQGVEEAFR